MGRWQKIVTRDGVMMVAPSSIAGSTNPWRDAANDGIDFIKALVDDLEKKYPIDRSRIYLAGYSAGACHSCRIGTPNSDFFSGIIAFAGASGQGLGPRKIPVALIHGTADKAVGFDSTQRLADQLKAADWPLFFKPLEGAGHSYNPQYDQEAWRFLLKNAPPPPPEILAQQSLDEAKTLIKRKKYGDAYAQLQTGLETGELQEELNTALEELLAKGEEELAKADDRGRESGYKKLLKLWKDTPIAEKAQAAIDALKAADE
jgi:predicted esterase